MSGVPRTTPQAGSAEPTTAEAFPPMFPGGNRIGREEEEAVQRVIRSKRLFRYYGVVDGPSEVDAFERDFERDFATRHAVAVGSGTLSLMAALAAAGMGTGDQVIVPSYTWVSTAAAVVAVGAVPVLAEIDDSLTIDVRDAEARITPRTRAIIPVHMRGAPADMDAIGELAQRHGLTVIEDTAQAIGGRYRGRRLGTIGDVGCFSLQYNKIITCGEGGVVVTDDPALHERILMYHDVAATQRQTLGRTPAFFGAVCRMSELQGAVAGVQLTRMDEIIRCCRANRARIVDHVAAIAADRGIRLRRCHDEDGDTAIALVLLCPDAATAGRMAARLRSSNLPARILFEPEREDFHVASHWAPLIARRSWSADTPWTHAGSDVVYGPECWTRSVDVLGRAVHLDVSPDLDELQLERFEMALADAVEAT